jgi:diacylglycerol kinase family enzyme
VRCVVILNEKAGKSGKSGPGATADELRAAFAGAGLEADIRIPGSDQLAETVRAAVAEGPDVIVAGGGDGTVRSVAAALADTGITLGVLPLGTLNHFAKDLQLPMKPAEVVALLVAGSTREVDVGEVNGHVFINNCSLGAYAEAVRRRDRLRQKHGVGKWWAMIRASLDEFRRLRRLRLRISIEQGARSEGRNGARAVRTPVVVVGNNRYSGHLLSKSLRPRLDAGELWLYTVQARRHLALIRLMLRSLFGRLDEAEHLAAEAGPAFLIESDSGPIPIAADGEVLTLSPPFHFRIRPRALRVVAPSSGDGERRTEDADGATEVANPLSRPTELRAQRPRRGVASLLALRWPGSALNFQPLSLLRRIRQASVSFQLSK